MSGTIAQPMQITPPTPSAEPTPRRWTREEYYRMGELDMFHGQRVELIEGEIIVLSPQKAEHWTTTDRVTELLRHHFAFSCFQHYPVAAPYARLRRDDDAIAVAIDGQHRFAADLEGIGMRIAGDARLRLTLRSLHVLRKLLRRQSAYDVTMARRIGDVFAGRMDMFIDRLGPQAHPCALQR